MSSNMAMASSPFLLVDVDCFPVETSIHEVIFQPAVFEYRRVGEIEDARLVMIIDYYIICCYNMYLENILENALKISMLSA